MSKFRKLLAGAVLAIGLGVLCIALLLRLGAPALPAAWRLARSPRLALLVKLHATKKARLAAGLFGFDLLRVLVPLFLPSS